MDDLARDVDAIGEEWGVAPVTRWTVIGLQLMAMADGCRTADEGLAWAQRRGYVRRREGEPDDSPTAYEVTDAGAKAVRAWHADVHGGTA